MSGNIGYQILRGSETYDPSTSEKVLLDGQLFYSKKTKELYVGDGESTLSLLKGTQIGLSFENGEGGGSLEQNGYTDANGSAILGAIASGEGAVAFGGQRYDKAGESIEAEPITEARGKQSFASGGGTKSLHDWTFTANKDTTALQRSDTAFGGGTRAGRTFREYLVEYKYPNTSSKIEEINNIEDDAQLETDYATEFEAYNKQHHYAFAHGENSIAKGVASAAFGKSYANGYLSFATGWKGNADGQGSFVAGQNCRAIGNYSAALGNETTASGLYSLATGSKSTASGTSSRAEGAHTIASGHYSHAEGYQTRTGGNYQHVSGTYNIGRATTLFEVGNGSTEEERSNAFEVYKDGRAKSYVDIKTITLEDNDLVPVAYMKQYIKEHFTELMNEYLAENNTTY